MINKQLTHNCVEQALTSFPALPCEKRGRKGKGKREKEKESQQYRSIRQFIRMGFFCERLLRNSMKFNSRLVIPVYRFWIRVTQVRALSPRHARPVTFYRARSHIVRVDAQRSAAHRCAVAVAQGCTTCETDGILDARDERLLYFRPPLESASNSIIRVPKRKRNLGSFALEYIRAMKLKIYSSS